MLYRKIIITTLVLIELFLGILILILWTLAYPFIRLHFLKTNRYKHHPSVILFKSFVWVNNLLKINYSKK
jgi:hypothetical protein